MCFSVGVAALRAARFACFGVSLFSVYLFGPSHHNAKNAKSESESERGRVRESERVRE